MSGNVLGVAVIMSTVIFVVTIAVGEGVMTTDELRKALEPWAKLADEYSEREDDGFLIVKDFDVLGAIPKISLADLRRARTAYAALGDIREATIEECAKALDREAAAYWKMGDHETDAECHETAAKIVRALARPAAMGSKANDR